MLWRPAAALQRRRLPPPQLAEAAPRRARAARLTALRTRAAMFDGLSRSLEKAWDSVRRDGKLTAENVKEPMREIRCVCLFSVVVLLPAPAGCCCCYGFMWHMHATMQCADVAFTVIAGRVPLLPPHWLPRLLPHLVCPLPSACFTRLVLAAAMCCSSMRL